MANPPLQTPESVDTPLTVKALREFLAAFPDDMQVLETRCSDLGPMSITDWGVIEGRQMVSGRYGWVQRVEAMTDGNRAEVKQYLHFSGN